jgi:hypothetical protein
MHSPDLLSMAPLATKIKRGIVKVARLYPVLYDKKAAWYKSLILWGENVFTRRHFLLTFRNSPPDEGAAAGH